jgi:hypothetical protein
LTSRNTDQDAVRISIVLGPVEQPTHTYTQPMYRWQAEEVCRDFAHGIEWDGKPVLRALIVP